MKLRLHDIRVQLAIVAGILLLISLAAIALLLSPAGRGRGARQQTLEQLKRQQIEMSQEVTPLEGMDQKIATAREQQATFTGERMPQRYSTVSEQLAKIASEAGVTVTNVKYDEGQQQAQATQKEKSDIPPGYERVGITILVHGSYEQNLRFINAVEQQKMMLTIDGVGFSGMQGNQLAVTVHLSTYLRSAA